MGTFETKVVLEETVKVEIATAEPVAEPVAEIAAEEPVKTEE